MARAVLHQNDFLEAVEIPVANGIDIQNFIYNRGYYDFLFLCVHIWDLLSVNFKSTKCKFSMLDRLPKPEK